MTEASDGAALLANMQLTTASKFRNEMALVEARAWLQQNLPPRLIDAMAASAAPFDRPIRVCDPRDHDLFDACARVADNGLIGLRVVGGRGLGSGWKSTPLFNPKGRAENASRLNLACPRSGCDWATPMALGKLLVLVVVGLAQGNPTVMVGSPTRR